MNSATVDSLKTSVSSIWKMEYNDIASGLPHWVRWDLMRCCWKRALSTVNERLQASTQYYYIGLSWWCVGSKRLIGTTSETLVHQTPPCTYFTCFGSWKLRFSYSQGDRKEVDHS